jgi:hypothetical protein
MYRVMKKNIANSEPPTISPTAFAPVRVRFWKMRNGTSGACDRSSIEVNTPSSATANASRPIVCVEPQPALSASTIA